MQTPELRLGIKNAPLNGRLHCSLVRDTPGSTDTEAVCDAPEKEAVMAADCLAATAPAEAVYEAEAAPPGMVSDAGTVTAGMLEDKETTDPPVGALPDNVTVQALPEPPITVGGVH